MSTDREKRILRLLREQDPLYAGLIREATGLTRHQVRHVMDALMDKILVGPVRGARGRSAYALTPAGLKAAYDAKEEDD